jgi:undecaprenyl-diphosphatase
VSLLEAIVLGITQGLTEFLPISSTGHLRIVPALVGWDDPGTAFTAVIQLGTMAAVVIYFRTDLVRISVAWLRSLRERSFLKADLDARLGWYIVIGTIPIGVFGLAFKDQIETGARDLYLIGSALIVLGLVLALAEKVGTRERDIEHIRPKDGVAIGLAQSLALIPGVSRSGSTITAGLFMGLDRPAAARFSFLLSIPAVVLSGLFEFAGIVSGDEHTDTSMVALAVATVFAFLSGYAAIAFLLRYLERHSTLIFVYYRVVLGALVIALAAAGAIK